MATPLSTRRGGHVVVWVAALALIALTLRLGFWQLDRARQKQAMIDRLHERQQLPALSLGQVGSRTAGDLDEALIERRIELQGRWLPDHSVVLDNRQMGSSQPGFLVLAPLELAPGDVVLVQRGWAPRDLLDRTKLPSLALPAGRWIVEGRVAGPPAHTLAMGTPDAPGSVLRQNLDLAAWAHETGLAPRPWTLRQTAPMRPASGPAAWADDALRRQWPQPVADVSRHQGYAFQWFALSALTAGLLLWFQLLRPRIARRSR